MIEEIYISGILGKALLRREDGQCQQLTPSDETPRTCDPFDEARFFEAEAEVEIYQDDRLTILDVREHLAFLTEAHETLYHLAAGMDSALTHDARLSSIRLAEGKLRSEKDPALVDQARLDSIRTTRKFKSKVEEFCRNRIWSLTPAPNADIVGAATLAIRSKSVSVASLYEHLESLVPDINRIQEMWVREVVPVFGPQISATARRALIDNGMIRDLIEMLADTRSRPVRDLRRQLRPTSDLVPIHESAETHEIFEHLRESVYRLCTESEIEDTKSLELPLLPIVETKPRTKPSPGRVLIVDDEPSMIAYTRTLLEMEGYLVESVSSGEGAVERMHRQPTIDVIFLEIAIPGMDGFRTIEACKNLRPEQKIIVVSSATDIGTVVQAIRMGAADYMTKPFYKRDLDAALKRCLAPERPSAADSSEHVESLDNELFFLAASPAMKQIRAQISLVAKVDVPVLLLGESGVGKEILARLIHKLSHRAHNPLLKVNCAALPVDLLESELFGYEPGAFTGATRPKPGKFELCNKGTILLDEIGEMSPVLQAKLLHVLQDGQFSRLGGRTTIAADFRVLAATNIEVQKAIAEKTFREDLYYRLSAFTVALPPLRERREEIPLLFKHFMNRFSQEYAHPVVGYSEKLVDACMRYRWPGNLREMGNFVKRYMVLQDEELAISELESKSRNQAFIAADKADWTGPEVGLKSLVRNLKDKTELKTIEEALIATNWNRKLASIRLNMSYKALLYKLKQYDLTFTTDKSSAEMIGDSDLDPSTANTQPDSKKSTTPKMGT